MDKRELFDDLGNFKIVPGRDVERSRWQKDNEKMRSIIVSVNSWSYLAIFWGFGAFYSFLIEKNVIIGCMFLIMISATFLGFIIMIWKQRL